MKATMLTEQELDAIKYHAYGEGRADQLKEDLAALAQPPAALAKEADLISHLRCVLFTNGIEGAKHMAVIEDFRAALAKVEPPDLRLRTAVESMIGFVEGIFEALHYGPDEAPVRRFHDYYAKNLRAALGLAPLVFPSEPRPPLGHQTESDSGAVRRPVDGGSLTAEEWRELANRPAGDEDK